MNICLVSQEYPPETNWGGIGVQTWNKARALAGLGHNVHVLSRAADQGPPRSSREQGVTVHRMQPPGFDFPIYARATYMLGYSWHVLGMLHQLMQSVPFDVVDFAEFGGEGFAYQLDRTMWNWTPVVVQLHGPMAMFVEYMRWPDQGSRLHQYGTFVEQFSLKRADAIMSCSSSVADLACRYYDIPPGEIDVVHCGVDADMFRPGCSSRGDREDNPRGPTVLFVGSIVENKGAHTLVEAVLALKAKYPDICLRMIGSGGEELMDRLRERIRERDAVANFDFPGFVPVDRLPDFYRQADVFCSPAAEYESFGQVCIEAMACGCPVVASTAGGGPEAVIEGVTGLLVPPNDIAAIAVALDRLLSDQGMRRRMGEAGRRRVEEYFALDKFIARVLAVYDKAIARSQQNPERLKDERQ